MGVHLKQEKWSWSEFLIQENLQYLLFFVIEEITDVTEERA